VFSSSRGPTSERDNAFLASFTMAERTRGELIRYMDSHFPYPHRACKRVGRGNSRPDAADPVESCKKTQMI
jgi:hypothetical protein